MSIWGKLIGGATGLALGGPIGAILGIAAGHGVDKVSNYNTTKNKKFSKIEKEKIFASSVIALAAKLSKVDGHISKEEILAFKKAFEFSREDEKTISEIFNASKQNTEDYKQVAEQFYLVFKNDKSILVELLNALFTVAYADGHLHKNENEMLSDISKIFNLNSSEFESIKNIHQDNDYLHNKSLSKYYKILGVAENLSMIEINKKYKQLIKEYHPDRLQGLGLPEDFIDLANKKLMKINEAYNFIKNKKKESDGS